jgi:hypothetical protein
MPKKINVKNARKRLMARRNKNKAPVNLSNAITRRTVSGANRDAKWMQRVVGTECLGSLFELDQTQLWDFNQLELGETRTGHYFRAYEKHFVHSLKYRFEPTLGASATGQVSMAFEHDVTDVPPAADVAVTQFASFADNVLGPVSQVQTLEVRNRRLPDGAWQHMTLFNDPSDGTRESCFGSLRTIVVGTGLASTVACGTLYVEYDVTFIGPEVEYNEGTNIGADLCQRLYVRGATTAGADFLPQLTTVTNGGAPGAQPFLQLCDAAGNPYSMDPGDIISTIYEGTTGGFRLQLPTGKDVPVGTHIFIKPSLQTLDISTPQGENLNSSSLVGWVSTALGAAGVIVSFMGALNDYATLRRSQVLRMY